MVPDVGWYRAGAHLGVEEAHCVLDQGGYRRLPAVQVVRKGGGGGMACLDMRGCAWYGCTSRRANYCAPVQRGGHILGFGVPGCERRSSRWTHFQAGQRAHLLSV